MLESVHCTTSALHWSVLTQSLSPRRVLSRQPPQAQNIRGPIRGKQTLPSASLSAVAAISFVFNNLVSAAVINKSNFWDFMVTPECMRVWTWWRWKKKHLWWRLVWSPPIHSEHSGAVIATLAIFMNLQLRIKLGGIVAMGVTVALPGSGLRCQVVVAGKRKATQTGSVKVYGWELYKTYISPVGAVLLYLAVSDSPLQGAITLKCLQYLSGQSFSSAHQRHTLRSCRSPRLSIHLFALILQ